MTRRRVIVAGGGVGGLEAALALRSLAFDTVDVTLLAPQREFVYRPLAVGEPFGIGEATRYETARIASERGFEVVRDALETVEPDRHRLSTQGGETLGYDALVLALGARPRAGLPGALTFRGSQDADRLAAQLRLLADGRPYTVAFVAPSAATWTLPVYELAMMTAVWARRERLPIDVLVVTAEAAPLGMFGDEASGQVAAALADRGVRLRTGVSAHRVGDGRLWLALERSEPADLAVALPRLAGPAVDGLPCDAEGFVAVDEVGRVHLVDDVYAVGDMADHPIKQGGLATQQADVAAAAVARWAGSPVPVEIYTPVLRGLLLTGGEPLCLRNPAGPDDSPWWPPHKIAGAYLPSYLATHGHFRLPVTT